MGILRFDNLDDKDEFRNKLRERGYNTTYKDNEFYIDNNWPKDERLKRRAVGKVKRALMEKQPERSDVVAMRDSGEVWVGVTKESCLLYTSPSPRDTERS
eukprot:12418999-Karenia_brevis.AAC.1